MTTMYVLENTHVSLTQRGKCNAAHARLGSMNMPSLSSFASLMGLDMGLASALAEKLTSHM